MAAVADPSYRFIRTPAELEQFVSRISQEKILAVDLEADSMFHFQEKVCLLQMAGNGENVVIDPLEVNDLSALAPMFKDKDVCKVFHGSDYDVRSLYRDFSIEINNLFDTQLASMFMGQRETSLGAVVCNRFGIQLDKRYQKKDWSQRPLPVGMIEYAASDVYHLIPLARMLMDELEEKGRLDWVKEECDYLSEVRPMENGSDPLFLRFRGAGRLPRRNLAALEGLLQYRRKLAEKKDRPLFKVISNTALLKIATEMAQTPQAMEAARCLSAKQIRIYGKPLSAIVKKANALAEKDLPTYPRKRRPSVSPRVPERIKIIKAWRDRLADGLGLDPALLFNKALMTAIAVKKPADLQALRNVEGIRNWQVKAFGKEVLTVLSALP
ncbi:ribonuclease D [Desulfosarcina sp.]|uniref:ribonuclease D n=1 Tax=Desulfosarcina sp. TaxID=2027861 RepID=UPI0029B0298D|nr:HRDC domain-containing protein [Desulfosarcina sp.]MDX2452188.1 HRDC domain-containing protein [Desulfosarcina sp.]MDX2489981.1 HRDC domain-containing protein [Desulfosarcina sp.]